MTSKIGGYEEEAKLNIFPKYIDSIYFNMLSRQMGESKPEDL